jgi:hypothetical protein
LTFRAGVVDSTRFIPASNSAVYTASGRNEQPRTSMVPLDGAGPPRLDFATGMLASVSPRGELALISRLGRLSRMSPDKGPAQTIAEGARGADWLPDGSGVALVRRHGADSLLEFPTWYTAPAVGSIACVSRPRAIASRFSSIPRATMMAATCAWSTNKGMSRR